MKIESDHQSAGDSPQFSIFNFSFLRRCIDLAQTPGAAVEPNPRVGAVVVHDGKIIGEGFHGYFGGPHAEVMAVAAVKDRSLLADSTLYVSLEPCNHHGKTPPCTGLILESGIRKVVVGAVDPNPQMAGKSIAQLRQQGVDVQLCPDAGPFLALNRHFHLNQAQQRPYIVLKWAQSADGFISGLNAAGEPEPRAISSPASNRFFHALRHDLQAIWIGRRTAAIDNPQLNTRLWPGRNPLRIVSDPQLSLPVTLKVFQGSPTLVVNKLRDEVRENVRFWKFEQSHDLAALVSAMYKELKIGSVLVEGGRVLLQQFLDAGLWDECYRCTSPQLLAAGTAAPTLPQSLRPQKSWRLGGDQIEHYTRSALAK